MILTRLNKFLLVVFLLVSSIAFGSKTSESTRGFDDEAMSAYAESATFDYMNYRLRTASIWDMLKWWLQDLWIEFWRDPVASRLTIYLFIALMLGIAIFYLVKIKYGRVLAKSSSAGGGNEMIMLEDIEEVDYKSLIKESLRENNFKLAIRYLYLSALVRLADNEVITLKDWKTPYDYGMELPKEIKPHYAQLSTLFEYVWYGGFGVSRADFDKCRNLTEKIQEGIL